MFFKKQNKRPLGRVLLDGGFLSSSVLDTALEEQKHTNELLGQVLVRMHVVDKADIAAVLSVQAHLDRRETAVKTAAGIRQMLGALLVQAGHITDAQLEESLAEQKRTGEKLGEVLVRRGLVTGKQLEGLLEFQKAQDSPGPAQSPLRLGEILVTTGVISRDQLARALVRQSQSGKKLGEILIEEGYAEPHHVKRGLHLQHMLLTATLVALLAACGKGSSGTDSTASAASPGGTAVTASSAAGDQNMLKISGDDYGLVSPDSYAAVDDTGSLSLQANVTMDGAGGTTVRPVISIDIPKLVNGAAPSLNATYSIEDNAAFDKFPGSFLIYNGKESTTNKVEQGIVTFTSDSSISGSIVGVFDVILTDYDSGASPPPQHHIKGIFSFRTGA